MDVEDPGSMPSTPVTPSTPGAPLFGGFREDRPSGTRKKSRLGKGCNCFTVDTWPNEEGSLPAMTCTITMPPPPVPLAKKVVAEFIGTLILIFAGTATAIVNQKTDGIETLIGLAGSAGLAVMIIILATGHISGAHLNPALTIAFAALKHFPWTQVPLYIGAQILASLCAAFMLKAIFHPMMGGGVTVPSVNYGQAFSLEFIISFNLMFVVTAVATDTRAVSIILLITTRVVCILRIIIFLGRERAHLGVLMDIRVFEELETCMGRMFQIPALKIVFEQVISSASKLQSSDIGVTLLFNYDR